MDTISNSFHTLIIISTVQYHITDHQHSRKKNNQCGNLYYPFFHYLSPFCSARSIPNVGYDVGTRTMTDVLNATQKLYDSMQKSAESRYNYIESRLALLYAEGDLKVEHINQINSCLNYGTYLTKSQVTYMTNFAKYL